MEKQAEERSMEEQAEEIPTCSQPSGVSSEPTSSENVDYTKKKSAEQVVTSSGQGGPSVDSKRNPSEHVEFVRSLLNRKMRVRVVDGRFYTGLFYCMDKQGNIILKDAVEHIPEKADPSKYSTVKHEPVVFIPVTTHKSIHMMVESPVE